MAKKRYSWPAYEKTRSGYVACGPEEAVTAVLVYADSNSAVKGFFRKPVEKVGALALLYYPFYVACILRQCLVFDAGGWIRDAKEPIDNVIEQLGALADISILVHESSTQRLPGLEVRARKLGVNEKYLEEHIMPDEAYIPMPPGGDGYYYVPLAAARYVSLATGEERTAVYMPLYISAPIRGYGRIEEFPGLKKLFTETEDVENKSSIEKALRSHNLLDEPTLPEILRKGLLTLMKKRIIKPSQMARINTRYI